MSESEKKRTGMIKIHYIPSLVFVSSSSHVQIVGMFDPDIKRMSLRGSHASD